MRTDGRKMQGFKEYRALLPPERVKDDAELALLVESLRALCGPELIAILFFGSRMVGSNPDRTSAYDLVLVVDRYLPVFRGLREGGRLHRHPLSMGLLSQVLAPTNLSFRAEPPDSALAKLMTLSERDFRKALSARPPDHFCLGRLIHRVGMVYSRDEESAARIATILHEARERTVDWVAPSLPPRFTLAEYASTMMATSFSGEIRPEASGRSGEVTHAQSDYMSVVYEDVLDTAVDRGQLRRVEGVFELTAVPGRLDRLRWRWYFKRSEWRSTFRWFKHVLTFEEWLDYIARKVERRMGIKMTVTPRERRLPFIFLWPKVVRVLRARR